MASVAAPGVTRGTSTSPVDAPAPGTSPELDPEPASAPGPLQRLAAVLRWPAPAGAFRRLVDPLAAGSGVLARIESIVVETERASTIVLRLGRGWTPHRAGQWVSVGVDVDGVRHHRCYSITSLPSRDRVTITVQSVPGGIVSNHLITDARPGDVVHLDGPDGDFTLEAVSGSATAPRRLLMVTGGSGITPVLGMLRALDAGVEPDACIGDVVILHHAPSERESLFTDELLALERRRPGVRVHLVATGAGAPPPELELRSTRLDELCPDWRDREAWACGPQPLVDAIGELWGDGTTNPHGTTEPLHVERFTPSTQVVGDQVAGTLTFAAADVSIASDGTRTVLELAEEAGLAPVAGCRMGVCRRCVVPLRSGAVVDLRDGRCESEAGTHVQICISAPLGDAELDL